MLPVPRSIVFIIHCGGLPMPPCRPRGPTHRPHGGTDRCLSRKYLCHTPTYFSERWNRLKTKKIGANRGLSKKRPNPSFCWPGRTRRANLLYNNDPGWLRTLLVGRGLRREGRLPELEIFSDWRKFGHSRVRLGYGPGMPPNRSPIVRGHPQATTKRGGWCGGRWAALGGRGARPWWP